MNDDFGFTYLLNEIAKESKVAPSEIIRLAGQVSSKESKSSPTAVQIVKGNERYENLQDIKTGPGRGMFQMEGSDASGYTVDALRRLKRFYRAKGTVAPEWVQELPEDFDPTKLTAEQQMMLFMAKNTTWGAEDKDLKGTTFSDITKKGFDPSQWWAKYHKKVFSPVKDDAGRIVRTAEQEKQRQINAMITDQNLVRNNPTAFMSRDELLGTPDYLASLGRTKKLY